MEKEKTSISISEGAKETHYSYITRTLNSKNSNISETYAGWIDLFGWGTGNNPTNYSENNNDYTSYYEWGDNQISNGGNSVRLVCPAGN